jgi:type I restriction enzyme M protein
VNSKPIPIRRADIPRGNADLSKFRGYVFALLFYKRINDYYDEEVCTQVDTLIKPAYPKTRLACGLSGRS